MRLARPFRPAPIVTALVLLAMLGASWQGQALSVPHPRQRGDYKRQVEALEEQWKTYQLANDVVAMDKLLSDDYIGISMNGQVYTKAQQLSRMRNKDLVLTRISIDEMKVKLIGSIAIVTSHTQIEGTNDGTPVKGSFRYMRVYKRLPSGVWKITSFEVTRSANTGSAIQTRSQ